MTSIKQQPEGNEDSAESVSLGITLALDRTLFSCINTSLSLTAFGFTLAKFVHDLIEKGVLKGVQPSYPSLVGFALMGLGLFTLLGGAVEYVRLERKLGGRGLVFSISLSITLLLAVVIMFLIGSLVAELHQP